MYEIQKYLGCATDNIILTWNDIWDKIDITECFTQQKKGAF